MSEMVDRAARAAFEVCYGDTHTAAWTYAEQDDKHGTYADEELRERFRKIARAVIEAVCEPTAHMCNAQTYTDSHAAAAIWRAMAKAILK